MKYRSFQWVVCSIFIVISLSACSTSSPCITVSNSQIISSGSSFGQSFTAQNRGLSAISILLAPSASTGQGSLLFHLRSSPEASADIARASLPITQINGQRYYRFDFPVQNDSQRKDYFLQIDIEDGGQVKIFTAPGNSYLDGAFYKDQVPQDTQLGFRLEYDKSATLLGLLQSVAGWIPVILIGMLLFVLPGWGLLSLLWLGWSELNWGTKLGLSGGFSLACYPILMLWTNLVGLHLAVGYALLPPAVGAMALLWKNRQRLSRIPSVLRNKTGSPPRFRDAGTVLADAALVITIALVILSRFWIVRSLDVPLYGDSYQHSVITQLIIDHGGLFDSWAPYADLATFTYHFGFHSLAAVYHWMSGATAEQAVLWTGQLVNVLAILALYPLTFKITRSRWAAVISVLIAGLVTQMPSYYVNWGRYTQLAGQVLLPVVVYLVWSILDRTALNVPPINVIRSLTSWRYLSLDTGSLVIAWIALAGLALTHYRILILAILFFIATGFFSLRRKKFTGWLGRIGWIGIGGLILFLPWLIHVFGGKIVDIFTVQVTTPPSAIPAAAEFTNILKNLNAYLPPAIWILILPCLAIGLFKRTRDLAILAVWWMLIILASNPYWMGLPGVGVISDFTVVIAFYIPAAIIIAAALAWLPGMLRLPGVIERFSRDNASRRWFIPSLVFLLVCGVGLWGAARRVRDLDLNSYALITRPDLRAMAWIQQNLPNDATFLVNSFFAYYNTVTAGSDGGWWIPLLAGRKTNLPPLTYGFEDAIDASGAISTNDLAAEIKSKGITDPQIVSLLLQNGFNYVYIGQRQGTVNYRGPAILDPIVLKESLSYKVVYHKDRVWIFQVVK